MALNLSATREMPAQPTEKIERERLMAKGESILVVDDVPLHPDQKVLISSGYAESSRVCEDQQLGAGAYVKKPFLMETLAQAVRSELDENSPIGSLHRNNNAPTETATPSHWLRISRSRKTRHAQMSRIPFDPSMN